MQITVAGFPKNIKRKSIENQRVKEIVTFDITTPGNNKFHCVVPSEEGLKFLNDADEHSVIQLFGDLRDNTLLSVYSYQVLSNPKR